MALDPSINKTGNTVPSDRAADIQDDSLIFDTLMTDLTGQSVLDRLGQPRKSFSQFEQEADTLLLDFSSASQAALNQFSVDSSAALNQFDQNATDLLNQKNQEFNDAISAIDGVDIGVWTIGITTFNSYNEYSTFDRSGTIEFWRLRSSVPLGYVATTTDPANETNFVRLSGDPSQEYINIRDNSVSRQTTGLVVFPDGNEDVTVAAQINDTVPTGTTSIRLVGGDFGVTTQFWLVSTDGSTNEASGNLDSFTLTRSAGVASPYTATIGGVDYLLLSMQYYPKYDFRALYPEEGSTDTSVDNYPILSAAQFTQLEWTIIGDYYSSQTLTPDRPFKFVGVNVPLGFINSNLYFPPTQGGLNYAPTVNTFESAKLHGIALRSTAGRAVGGTIYEYKASTGKIIFSPGVSPRPAGRYTVVSARTPTNTTATIDISNETVLPGTTITWVAQFYGDLFVEGEVITNTDNGETATVGFASERTLGGYAITVSSNNFFDGTGAIYQSGSKTATLYFRRTLAIGTRIADCTIVSGSIGDNDNSGFTNETFVQEGTSFDGILMNRAIDIKNVGCFGFGRNGLYAAAQADGFSGNVNNARVRGFSATNCGLNGIIVAGSDANVMDFQKTNSTQCFGFGIVDRSFLGCSFVNNHISGTACGSYNNAGGGRNSVMMHNYVEQTNNLWPFKNDGVYGSVTGRGIAFSGLEGEPIKRYTEQADAIGGVKIENGYIESGRDNLNRAGVRQFVPSDSNRTLRLPPRIDTGRVLDRTERNTTLRVPVLPTQCRIQTDFPGNRPTMIRESRVSTTAETVNVSGTGVDAYIELFTDGNGTPNQFIIHSGGRDYDETTTVSLGGSGIGFDATPIISEGVIKDLIINDWGSGYTEYDIKPIDRTGYILSNRAHAPGEDNQVRSGDPSLRWTEIFAVNGSINTSDENEKTDFTEISQEMKNAALEVKANIKLWRWISSKSEKGDEARYHAGPIAQDVYKIFDKHGINAFDYGFMCRDDLLDDNENIIGERWGLRPTQLLWLIIAAM